MNIDNVANGSKRSASRKRSAQSRGRSSNRGYTAPRQQQSVDREELDAINQQFLNKSAFKRAKAPGESLQNRMSNSAIQTLAEDTDLAEHTTPLQPYGLKITSKPGSKDRSSKSKRTKDGPTKMTHPSGGGARDDRTHSSFIEASWTPDARKGRNRYNAIGSTEKVNPVQAQSGGVGREK